jgi:hypothetical protein
MAFQAYMSNTAWQRGVSSMESAGLSPMLAYSQGPASTPGGAMATMGNALGAGVNSALSTASTMGQVENMFKQGENIDAQTRNTDSVTALNTVRAARMLANTDPEWASARQSDAGAGKASQDTANAAAALPGIVADAAVSQATQQSRIGYQAERARQEENLADRTYWETFPAQTEAEFSRTPYGRYVAPYTSSAKQISDIYSNVVGSLNPISRFLPRQWGGGRP